MNNQVGHRPVPSEILTTEEAAAFLKLSVPAVRWHIARGNIRVSRKIGHLNRFTREELDIDMARLAARRKKRFPR